MLAVRIHILLPFHATESFEAMVVWVATVVRVGWKQNVAFCLKRVLNFQQPKSNESLSIAFLLSLNVAQRK